LLLCVQLVQLSAWCRYLAVVCPARAVVGVVSASFCCVSSSYRCRRCVCILLLCVQLLQMALCRHLAVVCPAPADIGVVSASCCCVSSSYRCRRCVGILLHAVSSAKCLTHCCCIRAHSAAFTDQQSWPSTSRNIPTTAYSDVQTRGLEILMALDRSA
jgi:hypothetical protein